MNARTRRQVNQILERAEIEDRSETFLRRALDMDIPIEDGPGLRSMFRLAATVLELAYGTKQEANRALPWLIFSMGMAYERHYRQKEGG